MDGDEECQICRHWIPKQKFKKLVPCNHRLCSACVNKIEHFSAVGAARRCPFCRQDFDILQCPPGLVDILCTKLVWRLPKAQGLEKLPANLRAQLLVHLKNGRLLYGDTLVALLRGLHLKTLRLCDAVNMCADDLQRVVPLLGSPPTNVVMFNAAMLDDRGLQAVLQGACRTLQYLNVSSASDSLTGKSLQEFAHRMPNLVRLDLSSCKCIEPETLQALARGCASSLKELDVSGCRQMNDDAIASLAKCRELQKLKICGIWKLKTQAVLSILEACRSLCSLDVTHCRSVNGAELLQGVAAYCTELKDLQAGGLPDVDDASVIPLALSTAGSNLESWCIAGSEMTNESLKVIRNNCPVLRRLDIADCHDITEDGVLDTVMEMKQLWVCQTKHCRKISMHMQLFLSQMLAGREIGIHNGLTAKIASSSRHSTQSSSTTASDDCSSVSTLSLPSTASSSSSWSAPTKPPSAPSSPSLLQASRDAPSSSQDSAKAAAAGFGLLPLLEENVEVGGSSTAQGEVAPASSVDNSEVMNEVVGSLQNTASSFLRSVAAQKPSAVCGSNSGSTSTELPDPPNDAVAASSSSSGTVPSPTKKAPSLFSSPSQAAPLSPTSPTSSRSIGNSRRSQSLTMAATSSTMATRSTASGSFSSSQSIPREAHLSRTPISRASGSSSLLNAGATVGGQTPKAAPMSRLSNGSKRPTR